MVLARRASPVSSPDAVGGGLARVRYRKKAGSNNVDLHYLKARHQGFDSQECFPSSVLGCTDLFSTFIVGHRSVWFYNRVCLDLIDNDILKSCSPVKKNRYSRVQTLFVNTRQRYEEYLQTREYLGFRVTANSRAMSTREVVVLPLKTFGMVTSRILNNCPLCRTSYLDL